MKFFLFFCILFSLLNCSKPTFKDYIQGKISKRKGSPGVISINGNEYSAKNFREELYYERKHFQSEFTHPTPEIIQSKLEEYIEETILLEELFTTKDLESEELKNYLWPFIKKGLISYHLEKESGGYDLVENYNDTKISEKLVEEFIQKNNEKYDNSSKEKLKFAMRDVKWRKLYEASKENKKIIIAKMKKQNKVKILPGELYKLED